MKFKRTLYKQNTIRASSRRPPSAASNHTHHGIDASPMSLGKTSVVTLPTYYTLFVTIFSI